MKPGNGGVQDNGQVQWTNDSKRVLISEAITGGNTSVTGTNPGNHYPAYDGTFSAPNQLWAGANGRNGHSDWSLNEGSAGGGGGYYGGRTLIKVIQPTSYNGGTEQPSQTVSPPSSHDDAGNAAIRYNVSSGSGGTNFAANNTQISEYSFTTTPETVIAGESSLNAVFGAGRATIEWVSQ